MDDLWRGTKKDASVVEIAILGNDGAPILLA